MSKIQELVDSAELSFGRLTQREQFMIFGGGLGGGVLMLLLTGVMLASSINKVEHRIKVKSGQLNELIALQGEYKLRQVEKEQQLRGLRRSKVRLVSLVEDIARRVEVEIGQLRPEEGEPGPDGIVESRVDLRANGLSIDRLQKFLNEIENAKGTVVIQRLKILKPYRKERLDIELGITTYKVKSQGR